MTASSPTRPVARPTMPQPPAGAVRWARMWLDSKGVPQQSEFPVPVDDNDRRTSHIRWMCRGHIEVQGLRQPCDHVVWRAPKEKGGWCPDHGCALVSEGGPGLRAGLPWRDLWQAAELPARPLWALLAFAAAGAAVHAEAVPAADLAGLVPTLAAAGYYGVRWYLTRRAEARGRIDSGQDSGRRVDTIRRRARHAAYVGAGVGAWLTAAAATDPDGVAGMAVWVALPAAWAASSASWWRHLADLRNRNPEPVAVTVVPELSDDAKAAAETARMWTEGDIAANTVLDPATWQKIPCGWQAVIKATKRGALNNLGGDNMKATTKKVAGAFDVPKSAVTWIEEHEDNPNLALLLVQPVNPLKDDQIWEGPGSIEITDGGVYARTGSLIDGVPMREPLFKFGWGAPSKLVLGTTGSGKSEEYRQQLVIERWASFVDPVSGQRKGLFLSFLHDPKRMESYAEFRRALHGYGTTRDDAHIMADAFEREMDRRYDFLSTLAWTDRKDRDREGSVPWDPRVHGPILSAVWDEFHELAGADAELVKKLERIARKQRACAMRACVGTHMGTLGDTGSQALRDMLSGGVAILFRTTSALNAALATGGQLTADPRALPKVPGMCLVSDGETATLMGRRSYIPKDEQTHDVTLYDWLFDDSNNPIGYPAEIPPETAEAFGTEFMEWMAAGRQRGGRSGWSYAGTPAFVPTEDKKAADALRRILFEAAGPLRREEIAKHTLWVPRSVTSTLTAALKAGREAEPPWAVKAGAGPSTTYELSAAAREQMAGESAETSGDSQMALL